MTLKLQLASYSLLGPVFLEFPIDCLFPYAAVANEVGMKGTAQTLSQKVVQR